MLDLLHKTGYSSEDIVELCSIYQQQLQNLLTQAKLYSMEELSSEIHKLKGGASLLMMKDSLELIAIIEEMQKNDPAKVSYSEASRLIELGAGIEDLMNACGISRPEAELVRALTENKQIDIPTLSNT